MEKIEIKIFKVGDYDVDPATACFFVGTFEDDDVLMHSNAFNSDELRSVKSDAFTGKMGKVSPVVFVGSKRVVFVGLGKSSEYKNISYERCSELINSFWNEIKQMHIRTAVICFCDETTVSNVSLKVQHSSYVFSKYLTKSEIRDDGESEVESDKLVRVCLELEEMSGSVHASLEKAKNISTAQSWARDMICEPGNVLYPEAYADEIRDKCSQLGIDVKVYGPKDMEEEGMGAFVGVGQGSSKPPRFVVLELNNAVKYDAPVILVGKGVTFDTGGVCLKPSAKMWDMKYDMAGSAVVVATMMALALNKVPVRVIGLVGLVENAIGGNAQRPGDIVKSMSGKTIEVLNTDAEGRLVLADLLYYGCTRFGKPHCVIDLATLTGAIVVALGKHYAGLFSNDETLAKHLISAGKEVGEKLWKMPLSKEYAKEMKSSVADLRNISVSREGADSVLAAKFLESFVSKDVKWAHLDIAGVTWGAPCSSQEVATGFGVHLLYEFVSKYVING